jgi:hypothetical protein
MGGKDSMPRDISEHYLEKMKTRRKSITGMSRRKINTWKLTIIARADSTDEADAETKYSDTHTRCTMN